MDFTISTNCVRYCRHQTARSGRYSRLQIRATSAGVRASLPGNAVYLTKIRTDAGRGGEGHGSAALEILCDLADEHQVEMFLELESSGILDDDELANWYWGFGFRGDKNEMIREPIRPG